MIGDSNCSVNEGCHALEEVDSDEWIVDSKCAAAGIMVGLRLCILFPDPLGFEGRTHQSSRWGTKMNSCGTVRPFTCRRRGPWERLPKDPPPCVPEGDEHE